MGSLRHLSLFREFLRRNYSFFDGNALADEGIQQPAVPYLFAGPVNGDKELIDLLQAQVKEQQLTHCRGTGVSAETFYSCQVI